LEKKPSALLIQPGPRFLAGTVNFLGAAVKGRFFIRFSMRRA